MFAAIMNADDGIGFIEICQLLDQGFYLAGIYAGKCDFCWVGPKKRA